MKPTATVIEDCTQRRPTSHVVRVPSGCSSSPPLLSSLTYTYCVSMSLPNILKEIPCPSVIFFISFIPLKGVGYFYPFVSCLCPFFYLFIYFFLFCWTQSSGIEKSPLFSFVLFIIKTHTCNSHGGCLWKLCRKPLLMQVYEVHWGIVNDTGLEDRNKLCLSSSPGALISPAPRTSWITNIDLSLSCSSIWMPVRMITFALLVLPQGPLQDVCMLRRKLPCRPIDLMSLCNVLLCELCKLCCQRWDSLC